MDETRERVDGWFDSMRPGHGHDGRDLRRLCQLYAQQIDSDDDNRTVADIVALETLLAGGANLNPPCYVADRTLAPVIRDVYKDFWKSMAAFEDAHRGTLNALPWPPTPAGVLATAAGVEYDAMSDAPIGPPYTRESATVVSAAAIGVLPVVAARVRSGRA
ncbi:hypothetical protein psal_cds_196 [Pandoravirus salinus]|uniref:DUF5848 domain-containing protein n=1 Tax=Pandoravirus salinus TaxID=1349410 RepID=A0A291ATE1_9VIRU|nr:hypothetical protein psal_cds_196 [Pandoravirus salinus]ATE82132.1 hypothetical protein psal_cds_196 [Pandoravirus salinus]